MPPCICILHFILHAVSNFLQLHINFINLHLYHKRGKENFPSYLCQKVCIIVYDAAEKFLLVAEQSEQWSVFEKLKSKVL